MPRESDSPTSYAACWADSPANFCRVRSDVSHASKKRLSKKAISQQLTHDKNIPTSYQSWVKNVFAPALVKLYLRERDLRNGGSRA
jgi:hypothetical protein